METQYLIPIRTDGNEVPEHEDIEILEYKGEGGSYEYNNLNIFCNVPSKKTWNILDLVEKELLVTVSHFCLEHGKGDEELARLIIKISIGDSDEERQPMLPEDILLNIGSLSDCKTFIKSLTKKQVQNLPWEFINSEFPSPLGYPKGVNKVENPKICQGIKGCIEYYNKCLWLHELNATIAEGNAFELFLDNREFAANRMFVLAAVKQSGRAILYCLSIGATPRSHEFQADREIVLAAVLQDGLALEYAADELKADREIVLAAVMKDGLALEYASDELKADREIVLAAVTQFGFSLQYAADELKADREIVLAAVMKDGLALVEAAVVMGADREIVLTAVKTNGWALEYASDELKADREIVLAAVMKNGRALQYAADELKADREIVLAAVKRGKFSGIQVGFQGFESDGSDLAPKR